MVSKLTYTRSQRGFLSIGFKDRHNVACSLHESSLATEAAVWFGCDNADPKHILPSGEWVNIELPKDHIANTRMHLTQKQMKKLLPTLQFFADNGYLPEKKGRPSNG